MRYHTCMDTCFYGDVHVCTFSTCIDVIVYARVRFIHVCMGTITHAWRDLLYRIESQNRT